MTFSSQKMTSNNKEKFKMSSKLITALIILTVAALCAAAAFQYLEMESFGLPKTLQERFFPATPADTPAAAEESSSGENSENKNADENSNSGNTGTNQE